MAANSFWICYHFEEFRSQEAIGKKNSRPVSVLREWWEEDFCYLARVEDELLVRREGWEVVIELNATD